MSWKTDILQRIKPTREEEREVNRAIDNFLKKLNSVLGDARAILGGSGAKGTWLKGQHDADIFVVFPFAKYRERSAELSDILETKLKKVYPRYQRLHGSRDYFRVNEKSFIFEIVPILDIKKAEDARNITDVSPLHAAWVRKNSTEKLRDDIRVAKAFCKAQGCYGAESYVGGLSGYVLEILVIYTGGFERLLKAAQKWEDKQVVDAGKLYSKKEQVWMNVNESKLQSPLIVIDPVDRTRNAAAALSREKWELFRKKAAVFLKKDSFTFFEHDDMTLEKLQKKAGKNFVVWVDVSAREGKEDKVGAALKGAFDFLKGELEPFGVVAADWQWDKEKKAVFWLIVKKNARDKVELRRGPPAEMKEHAAEFRKKHKQVVAKKGVLWAKVPVKNYKLKDFVDEKIKEKYFGERVEKAQPTIK